MTSLKEFSDNIVGWAHARNLIKGATAQAQFLKLTEEFGELASAAEGATDVPYEEDVANAMDGLGDVFVVATIMAEQLGVHQSSMLRYVGIDNTNPVQKLGALGSALARGHSEQYMRALAEVISSAVGVYVEAFGIDVLEGETVAEWSEGRIVGHTGYEDLLCRCLTGVWNEIKDRKGVMYNGVFIKSTDDRYAGVLAELGIED